MKSIIYEEFKNEVSNLLDDDWGEAQFSLLLYV